MKFHTSSIRKAWLKVLKDLLSFTIKKFDRKKGSSVIPAPGTIKKLLVIRIDRIGDMILSTPVFESFVKSIKEGEVSVLANKYNKAVLKGSPYIKTIYSNGFKDIKQIRKAGYDACLVLTFDFSLKSALLCYLSGARYKIGFKDRGTDAFYNVEIEKDSLPKYEVYRNLELLEKSGIEALYRKPLLFPGITEEVEARKYFAGCGITASDLVIGLHPGSKRKPRRWPEERFVELSRLLEKKAAREGKTIKFIITEGPGEKGLAFRVKELIGENAFVLPPSEINIWAAVFKRFSLFVCGDTGPIHIAMAMDIPAAGIYGTSDYVRWSPPDNPKLAVIKGRKCKDISAEEVMESIGTLL
ncbi:MAG: glycosyltransferase family 9 protein [Candidatus Firestonebacteria bacterium]